MEILKDGAAAAIYGSVAANGVVIVTTKNGKKGETKIDFNAFCQFTSASNKFEMLNSDEYLYVHNMMYENAVAKKPGYLSFKDSDGKLKNPTGFDTNWQDEMLRNGLSQNYNVNTGEVLILQNIQYLIIIRMIRGFSEVINTLRIMLVSS